MSVACTVMPSPFCDEKTDGSPIDRPPAPTTTTAKRPWKCCTFPHSKVFSYISAVSHSIPLNVGKSFGLVDIGRMGFGKKYVVVGNKGENLGFVVVTMCGNF
jgi:hypothetical protein